MTETKEQDPLSVLEVDTEVADKRALADLLRDLIWINSRKNEIRWANGVRSEATNKQLVTLAICGQSALHLRREELPPGLRPKEVEKITGLPGGSVRPVLRSLVDDGLVGQGEDGTYRMYGHAVDALREEFEGLRRAVSAEST